MHGPVDAFRSHEICAQAQESLDAGARELRCEITGRVDLSLIDALCRLQLITARRDAHLRISARGCSEELVALLGYLGLERLAERLEPGRKAEAGE